MTPSEFGIPRTGPDSCATQPRKSCLTDGAYEGTYNDGGKRSVDNDDNNNNNSNMTWTSRSSSRASGTRLTHGHSRISRGGITRSVVRVAPRH